MNDPDVHILADSQLRRLQLVQLQLLLNFDKVCKKHNLTYWIGYGTVLGAVRHKGFIPWDDDIDVCMPMVDYKKFLKIAESELPEDVLVCYKHKGSPYNKNFAKLMDRKTTLIEFLSYLGDGDFRGIYMDIFPIVHYPAMPAKLSRLLCLAMCHYWWLANQPCQITFKNLIKNCWYKMAYFMGRTFWFCWEMLAKKSDNIEILPYDNGYGIRYHKDVIYPLCELEFEGHKFPAPHDPHVYLQTIYGDYMKLPPEEKRKPHALYFNADKPYPHPLGIFKQ